MHTLTRKQATRTRRNNRRDAKLIISHLYLIATATLFTLIYAGVTLCHPNM